jgi:cobalt-zinc-cadmium efflux system protein
VTSVSLEQKDQRPEVPHQPAPRGTTLPAAPDTRLIISLGLNLVITLLQVVGGIIANSLGLLSDAAHNLSDVVALGLSLWAVRLGRRPATPRRTFAYKRAEILVAMFNSAVLIAISVYIIVEACGSSALPPPAWSSTA